eukprot:TRINITY_DN16476_c0_g1_i1.p1 TRINITY_DN16476_c0_g1~~TRINITY_DN16476_c0_g1_i1.p1  ORF type:complete len:418 (+),score=117.78 TRINITY_DN16476_c0_g1_i1:110-1363(+)
MLRRTAVRRCDRDRHTARRRAAWAEYLKDDAAGFKFMRYLNDAYRNVVHVDGVDTRKGMALQVKMVSDFHAVGAEKVPAMAYVTAVDILAEHGQDDAIMKMLVLAEKHHGARLVTKLHRAVMKAQYRRGDYAGVRATWAACRRRPGYADLSSRDHHKMLMLLLRACAAVKDLAGAAKLVKSFHTFEKVAPTRESLELVLKSCATPSAALAQTKALAGFGYSIQPSTIAALLATANTVEEGAVYWRLLKGRGLAATLEVYAEAANLARRVGDPDGIQVLMREMEALGLRVGQRVANAYILCVAENVASYEEPRRSEVLGAAAALAHLMHQSAVRGAGLYVSLLKCYARAGLPKEAERVRALIVKDLGRTEQVKITKEVQRAYDTAGVAHTVTRLPRPADQRGGRSWVLREQSDDRPPQ